MTQRHFVTRWLGAFGLILSLVGLVSQGTASAQTALTETRQSADQGDAVAQYNLGARYYHGQGVPQDFTHAATWYRRAADQGHAAAQFTLGFLYDNGRGVPEDGPRAAAWYRKAADQGFAAAQYNLGVKHELGRNVPAGLHAQAVAWYRKAADQGFARRAVQPRLPDTNNGCETSQRTTHRR